MCGEQHARLHETAAPQWPQPRVTLFRSLGRAPFTTINYYNPFCEWRCSCADDKRIYRPIAVLDGRGGTAAAAAALLLPTTVVERMRAHRTAHPSMRRRRRRSHYGRRHTTLNCCFARRRRCRRSAPRLAVRRTRIRSTGGSSVKNRSRAIFSDPLRAAPLAPRVRYTSPPAAAVVMARRRKYFFQIFFSRFPSLKSDPDSFFFYTLAAGRGGLQVFTMNTI